MTTFVSAARNAPTQHRRVLHGFLDGSRRPVFGSYHAPERPVRDVAWVLCPPIGWEGIQVYQSIQRLAEMLAASGFHALRIAYDGTAESLGTDEEPGRVEAWLESIRTAVTSLAGLAGVRGVGVIGMRIGATLASKVAAETPVASLVLWEPCVSGAQYTREMEIFASASPRALQGHEAAPIEAGRIEAAGTLLTPETVRDLNALDLQKLTPAGKPDVLVVCRNDRPPAFAKKVVEHLGREGVTASLEQHPGFKEMMTYPEKAVPAPAFLERIRDWALAHATTLPDDATTATLGLAEEAKDGTRVRRPIRFGPDERIFGVLVEPTAKTTKRPVLFLTGGVVPRTAVNRMYVEMATALADRGHTVLRMDVSGICESAPAEGAAPNDPHAATLLGDVQTAIALLLAHTGQRSITLLGLCSGAYATFQTALADERVRSIVLLNPEVFHLKGGSTKFSETEQSGAAKHYRQSLFSAAAWKKLLTGKANVRYIAGFVGAKAKTTLEKGRDRIAARIKKVPQGVPGDIHRLLARDVKVAIVMAEGDPGHEPLMGHLGADLDHLKTLGFELRLVPGPDHTFNDFSTRIPLVKWLVERLST